MIDDACSAPPPSLDPIALRHSPWLIAWALAGARLMYRVVLVTDTAVCAALPVVVSVRVLPLTEPTAPTTDRPPPACGHTPLEAETICTEAAVTVPEPASLSCVGRTVTQSPAVTSDSCAGTIDEIFVVGAKSTVALAFCCATWMALPDTEAMSPAT